METATETGVATAVTTVTGAEVATAPRVTPNASAHGRRAADHIGPNAILQVVAAMEARWGAAAAHALLAASTPYTAHTLPSAMVAEEEARALAAAVLGHAGEGEGTAVLREAGGRTGDYLLAHRIPRVAQWVIRRAPPRAGLWLLLRAMAANAWTFVGSGRFATTLRADGATLTVRDCAMCRYLAAAGPVCAFYAGTFARLVGTLVSPQVTVREVECAAAGGACCRFEVRTGGRGRWRL